ncbi:cupin domain-containing protein [Roseibium sp.]|uniref:cupin domain-containing protein n=1 Tax=Roseibium sp. TaxID=1936156 RepID=UPI003A96FA33
MTLSPALSASEVVTLLNMQPHPEGGFYAETFRDEVCDDSGRPASTLIYFLLPEGITSRWHTVDAVETWHWYAGSPLELSISPDGDKVERITLGNDLTAGERPQGIVPRDGWQQARSLGAWTLVGCTVAPGFRFEGFRMAPDGWEPGSETPA